MGLHRGLKALAFFRWRNSISSNGRKLCHFFKIPDRRRPYPAEQTRLGDIDRGAEMRGVNGPYDALMLLTGTKEVNLVRQNRPEKAHWI